MVWRRRRIALGSRAIDQNSILAARAARLRAPLLCFLQINRAVYWRVFIPAEIDLEADLSKVLVELVKT